MAIRRNPDGIPEDVPSTKLSNVSDMPNNKASNISINVKKKVVDDLPTVTTGRLQSDGSHTTTDGSTTPGSNNRRSRLIPEDAPTEIGTVDTKIQKRSTNRLIQDGSTHGAFGENPTINEAKPQINLPTDEKTQIAGRKPLEDIVHNEPTGDSFAELNKFAIQSDAAEQTDAMLDPLAGWLVVIDGPGKGRHVNIGYGQNSIGRNSDQRISLDYGDKEISRSNHASVTYDPRSKQFFLQPGSGTNLIYVDSQTMPVLQPQILPAFSQISLGKTKLRFVPFCNEDFNWESLDEGK